MSQRSARFDGQWLTTLTCPAKGSTEGYTWQFGSVKLSATGIVASRKYARGIFAHQGEEYSYAIKAQFGETEGTGARNEGLGIVGRPCTFDFVKQEATNPIGDR